MELALAFWKEAEVQMTRRASGGAIGSRWRVQGRYCIKAVSCRALGGGGSLHAPLRARSEVPHSLLLAESCPLDILLQGLEIKKKKASHLANPRHGCHSAAFTFITRNAEDVGSPPPAPFPPESCAARPRQILVVNY